MGSLVYFRPKPSRFGGSPMPTCVALHPTATIEDYLNIATPQLAITLQPSSHYPSGNNRVRHNYSLLFEDKEGIRHEQENAFSAPFEQVGSDYLPLTQSLQASEQFLRLWGNYSAFRLGNNAQVTLWRPEPLDTQNLTLLDTITYNNSVAQAPSLLYFY